MDFQWIDPDAPRMNVMQKGEVVYLTFPVFDEIPWLVNGFSTRLGGVSEGHLSTMNLGFERHDKPENLKENFRRIAKAIGFEPENLVCSAQTHTTNVRKVTEEDRGRGYTRVRGWRDVDGLVTDQPDLVLEGSFADCVPLYFVDPEHRAIGLAHSGWRGTAKRMGEVTVKRMVREFGSDPSDIIAAIGPCICGDCYEVSGDVAGQFSDSCVKAESNGHFLLDLVRANEEILLAAGIREENIHQSNLCTCENAELLFSHRATQGRRGNLGAFLGIRKNS